MGLGLRTIEQKLAAGNDWTGVLPTTTLVSQDNLEVYGEDIVGGLLTPDPELCTPVQVRSVELTLSGQSVWTIHRRDRDGDETLLMCGTTEESFLTTVAESFPLLVKQSLVLRSTGATGKMVFRVTVQATV